MSNESYSYELRKDGNYYLEIEKSSEEALETLKWYAGKVRAPFIKKQEIFILLPMFSDIKM